MYKVPQVRPHNKGLQVRSKRLAAGPQHVNAVASMLFVPTSTLTFTVIWILWVIHYMQVNVHDMLVLLVGAAKILQCAVFCWVLLQGHCKGHSLLIERPTPGMP
jgi:hypothetical protein